MSKKTLLFQVKGQDFRNVSEEYKVFEDPIFTFVSPPKDGIVKALTDLTYCRESMCEYVRQQLKKVSAYGINIKMLDIVVYRRVPVKLGPAVFQKQMEASQKILNTIESHYGWPLTKMHKVELYGDQAKGNPGNEFYYVRATKRWIKAPSMLSLYLLLFRIGCIEKKHKFSKNITSFTSLFNTLNNLTKKDSGREVAYYREHGKHWRIVLDNYQKLFGRYTMGKMYTPTKGDYYFSEGINTLCDGDSRDKTLNKAFGELLMKGR